MKSLLTTNVMGYLVVLSALIFLFPTMFSYNGQVLMSQLSWQLGHPTRQV